MRGFFGFLLGIALTIGGSYVYDTVSQRPATDGTVVERPLVNWDVVSHKLDVVTDRARREWNKLTG
jgi:hypothetical protein